MMAQFGARVPIGTADGYQQVSVAGQGWKRLADVLAIPAGTTSALVQSFTDVYWMQAPGAMPDAPTGMQLANAGWLSLDEANQVNDFCFDTDRSPSFGIQFFTGPVGRLPLVVIPAAGGGGGGGVESVTGPNVDNTDPANPIVRQQPIPARALWVDLGGNDATALPYRIDRMFGTIQGAKAAYTPGDTIVVMPGTHDLVGMLYGSYNIHLMNATIVGNTMVLVAADPELTINVTGCGSIAGSDAAIICTGGTVNVDKGITLGGAGIYMESGTVNAAGPLVSATGITQSGGTCTLGGISGPLAISGDAALTIVGGIVMTGAQTCNVTGTAVLTVVGDIIAETTCITADGAKLHLTGNVRTTNTEALPAIDLTNVDMRLDGDLTSTSIKGIRAVGGHLHLHGTLRSIGRSLDLAQSSATVFGDVYGIAVFPNPEGAISLTESHLLMYGSIYGSLLTSGTHVYRSHVYGNVESTTGQYALYSDGVMQLDIHGDIISVRSSIMIVADVLITQRNNVRILGQVRASHTDGGTITVQRSTLYLTDVVNCDCYFYTCTIDIAGRWQTPRAIQYWDLHDGAKIIVHAGAVLFSPRPFIFGKFGTLNYLYSNGGWGNKPLVDQTFVGVFNVDANII